MIYDEELFKLNKYEINNQLLNKRKSIKSGNHIIGINKSSKHRISKVKDSKDTNSMGKAKPNFKHVINVLIKYFDISIECAKYIYYRRLKGSPFKEKDDNNYIEWSYDILLHLINVDKIVNFKWDELKFNTDLKTLTDIQDTSNYIIHNDNIESDWYVISDIDQITKMLQDLGF